jgi:hypothetical protein
MKGPMSEVVWPFVKRRISQLDFESNGIFRGEMPCAYIQYAVKLGGFFACNM